MLTFRAFLSPMDLYRLLMKRFNLPAPVTTHPSEIEHWKARVSTPTRLRCASVASLCVTYHEPHTHCAHTQYTHTLKLVSQGLHCN